MKRLNPFDSLTSPQERIHQARTRLRRSVLIAGGVCASSLMILLTLQGCKQPDDSKTSSANTETNNVYVPPFIPSIEPTNQLTSNPPSFTIPPIQTTIPSNPPPEMSTAGMRQHTVEKNDSFYTLSKKYTVSIKAIQDANSGVDSKKLKIGQKLNIPASSAATTPGPIGNGSTAGTVTAEAGGATYTVKSGDNLTKIATRLGTSVKALKAANNLTTDRIQVGQKLKVPAKATGTSTSAVTPTILEPLPGSTSTNR